ncbi:homoserine dehydrogenase [Halalkalibacter okhensis]|uniref:homoserine dehydrogenase n=1 Tax=Halalkalibacter okhensis TaxID=333138 RepID=UPI000691540A|nr:homoserine dehydrogenase [Halalkalibacter okhensis]
MSHKLALLGFGTVGQGLAEILINKEKKLLEGVQFQGKVVAISDLMKGALYHPDGLDLKKVLEVVKETGKLDSYPDKPGLIRGLNSLETIRETNAQTIVEVTFTDVKTGQPAIDHCKAAFEAGKNVVMSNKGPVALAYEELSQMAEDNGVNWGFEGTVMSGTPALRMPLAALAGNDFIEIRGILNGTTNFILSKMEEGLTYENALQEAQELGYAEADPTSDVQGFDARYKIVILSNLVLNEPLKVEDVECQGITELTKEDIELAQKEGFRWKLIASAKKEKGKVIASVKPMKLHVTDPLASINGAINAVMYECDLAGTITLCGPGAGKIETGYSLLIDLINIERGMLTPKSKKETANQALIY